MRTIKRYSNRKLYDTEDHRYITLLELGALVRKNVEVKVLDHGTGDNQTTVTLAQVILEEERRKPTVEVAVFEQVIREGIPEVPAAA